MEVSSDWKVKELVGSTGGMPVLYKPGQSLGCLDGPFGRLDLDDPPVLEKPLSVLGLSFECQVSMACGNRSGCC